MSDERERQIEEIENHAQEQIEALDLADHPDQSLAETAWRKRRNRRLGIQGPQSGTATTEVPETIQRLMHVVDNILAMAPPEVRVTQQYKVVATIIKEARKDLVRLPVDQVTEMCRGIGHALLWVADGRLEDIQEEVEDNGGARLEFDGQGQADNGSIEDDEDDQDPFAVG